MSFLIQNDYADKFFIFRQDFLTNIPYPSPYVIHKMHISGTDSILLSSSIAKNSTLTRARGGANGTIRTYTTKDNRKILMKYRAADEISSKPVLKKELQIDNSFEDPTQYEMATAMILDFYYNSVRTSFPQFSKILTCSQSNLPNQTADKLKNVLFVESVPGNVQSVMSYTKLEDTDKNELEKNLLKLMLDLYYLGNQIGFWHGDLHSGNILITGGRLVVIDLGRAYIRSKMLLKHITNNNTLDELKLALQNAYAKLLPHERCTSDELRNILGVQVKTAYRHILYDVFHDRYNYYNRHGHLAQSQTTLANSKKNMHPNVFKTVVLADIGGLALSMFSDSFLYEETNTGDNGMRCSLKGLAAILRAYMKETISNKKGVVILKGEKKSRIAINANEIIVIRPIGLLERIHYLQETKFTKKYSDLEYVYLQEMVCLWLLLYACITRELKIELPSKERILPPDWNRAVPNIISSLVSNSNIHTLDDNLIKYAFYVHGQPEMFTCDMFTILHLLWEKVPMSQGGGKKRISAKPPKRMVSPNRPNKRNMQQGGVITDPLLHTTANNTFEDAVVDALKYKPMSPSDFDIKKPQRMDSCIDLLTAGIESIPTTMPQTCAAAASRNMPAGFPDGVAVMGGGAKSKSKPHATKKKTSETYRYKQRDYVVYEGSRGGHYIRLKGVYVSIRSLPGTK